MSVPYGRRSPEPFAYFDPGCSSARTSQPLLGLGSWSEPSVTFPRWGSMRSGQCFRRPRWEPHTAGNDCSSSPGLLLGTPRCADGMMYQLREGVKSPRARLEDQVSLLPTPTASDRFGAGSHGEGGPDLRTTVSLLPTPKASDGEKGGPNQRGSSGDLTLPSAVMPLLPTPRVAATRTSRGAAMRKDSLSGPSLDQALEVARGELPREFTSWEEMPRSWRGGTTDPPSDVGS